MGPTYAFNNLVLDYRSENGFWPKSKLDLVRAGKNTIDQLEGMGFTDWYLGQDSQDSLYIHFVHIPVFENAHIGGVPIPGRQVKLKTLYTFPKRYIQTSLEK
ncbi:hypothetical protein [Dyadobacter tibetensis]|uniref:hypothetical protein n=1 Tax=Dyadobacter tibetensis TaxID=1211851 RepID=UPI0004710917|nr:hypothetical protein [Dyadobacter tibetensis]